MGEEKDDLLEREKDLKKKDCLLSCEGWIMLLSDEIQNCKVLFMMVGVLIVSSLLAIIGIVVMVLGSALFPLFVILGLYLGLCFFISHCRFQKRLRPLINLREDIISGKLTDLSKINRIWKDYIKKEYGKLLEKSEMVEEKKELNEGEEKSEEKGSGKSINEQKEVLQAMQRDISNSSQKITRIELGIERTKFVNYLSVVGGFTAAAGLALIVTLIGIYFSLKLGSSAIEYILVFSGVFLLGFGALMIRGTYQELPQKELFSIKKKLLHYAIIASCVSVSIVVLFFILF